MNSPTKSEELATSMLDGATAYGRALLAQQMRAVVVANLESESDRHQSIKDLFLVGAMCKVCEQFPVPSTPEDSAFDCLKKMQLDAGASNEAAERRVSALKRAAHGASLDGKSALKFGREFATVECALAALLAASAANQSDLGAMRFLLWVMAASLVSLAATVTLAQLAQVSPAVAWALGYAISWFVLGIGVAIHIVKSIPKSK